MGIAKPRCWICGDVADSAEHRIKKTDLVRAFGRGPYTGPNRPVHVTEGLKSEIKGPRSDRLKYRPSLCHRCNTTRTQRFDQAYDRFICWVTSNESEVLRIRYVDFSEIYGAGWETSQTDLFKFYVKSFGCRLVEHERRVPWDLRLLFSRHRFKTGLRVTFSVDEDILLIPKESRQHYLSKGPLIGHFSKSNPKKLYGYTWAENTAWFRTTYFYNVWPEPTLGSSWTANAQCVYLGKRQILGEDDRNELKRMFVDPR